MNQPDPTAVLARVRAACDQMHAASVLADGEPHTDRERGVVQAVARIRAALEPAGEPSADRAALRDLIAEALMQWAERNNSSQYASMRRPETVRANSYSRADAVLAVLPEPADRAVVLSEAECKMLTYALALAQDKIWSLDGFTREDQAALNSLRRLAGEQPTKEA